eukprot:TRINITY_DN44732_c0_g3_i1.p1 TRINITY_DN44732_c0_g3~~TRINITY_DN44732_c0_g3_i1.p1  ORF type:complete len:103 (+),score=15.24 TRINITY_DN44732_c0_g3_i1:287-595(+)
MVDTYDSQAFGSLGCLSANEAMLVCLFGELMTAMVRLGCLGNLSRRVLECLELQSSWTPLSELCGSAVRRCQLLQVGIIPKENLICGGCRLALACVEKQKEA